METSSLSHQMTDESQTSLQDVGKARKDVTSPCIIPHPSCCAWHLPVSVTGLAAAFLLLVGAKGQEWLRVTKSGGCPFDSHGLFAFYKVCLCAHVCAQWFW
uniref:Uncharacterized protein n=1 Tax=Anas platyrhynchos platyrhynchos TaxID=8840 RepID=A0A493SU41_ANAPP